MMSQPCGDQFLATYENSEFTEWVEQHKQVIQTKLEQKHHLRKLKRQQQKEEDVKLERKLPIDIMAKEWFNDNPQTGEMSCYLIDKLIPTLIMGLEKVLSEITRKGMLENYGEDESVEKTFHPLTYLAQYLIRNNPKHSNFPEASPYIRGLRQISEQIKRDVYDIKINKLARLKHEVKIQREEMEQSEIKMEKETEDREEMLKKQFSNWLTDGKGGVHRRAVTYSILSFSQNEAEESCGSLLVKDLNETEETPEFIGISNYIEIFLEYSKNFSRERFQELLSHLDRCSLSFQKFFEKESLHVLFVELFQSLDAEDIGFIDRERILNLVQTYWSSIEQDKKINFNHPQRWPVVEIAEQINYKKANTNDEESSNLNTKKEDNTENQLDLTGDSKSDELKTDDDKLEESHDGSEKEETKLDMEKETVKVKSEGGTNEETNEDKVTPEESPPDDSKEKEEVKPEETNPEDGKEEVNLEETNSEKGKEKEEVKPEETNSEDGKEKEEVKLEETSPADDKEKDEVKPDDQSNNEESKSLDDKPDEAKQVDGNEIESGPVIVKSEEIESDDQKEKKENKPEDETGKGETEEEVENKTEEIKSDVEKSDSSDDKNDEANESDEHDSDHDSSDEEEDNTRQLQTIDEEDEESTKDDIDETPNPDKIKGRQESETEENVQTTTIKKTESQTGSSSTTEEGHTSEDNQPQSETQSAVEEEVTKNDRKYLGSNVAFASKSIALSDVPTISLMNQRQLRSILSFYDNKMSKSSFSTLLNNFLNEESSLYHVERLVNHLQSNYHMNEEEKLQRINQNRLQKLKFKQKCLVDDLFDKWDVNCCGVVDANLVNSVLSRYKDGMDTENCLKAADEVMQDLQQNKSSYERFNLTKQEFYVYITTIVGNMQGDDSALENFVSFSTSTIEVNFEQRIRNEIRRKWIEKILVSSQTGVSMDNVYDVLFESILKDAELNGGKKKVAAYVGLLENNVHNTQRGSLLLRYVACTPDLSSSILGKALYEDTKGISFNVVKRGRLFHIPNTQKEEMNDVSSPDNHDSSLLLIPLQDAKRRTYGLFGISSRLDEDSENGLFNQHEVDFYQGVASVFSSSFHYIDSRRKLLRTVEAAISWMKRKLSFDCISVYFVEAAQNKSEEETFFLRMVHSETSGGRKKEIKRNCTLNNDNPFQSYLFDCAETSLPMIYALSGITHAVYPVRDNHGFCQCVIDMNFGQLNQSPLESDYFYSIINLLQEANIEILREMQTGEKTVVLDVERYGSDVMRVSLLFGRLVLQTIRSERLEISNFDQLISICNREEVSDTLYTLLRAIHLLLFRTDPDEVECLPNPPVEKENENTAQSNEEASESDEELAQSDEEELTQSNEAIEKQLTKLELCLKMVNDSDFKAQLIKFDPTVKHPDDDETLVPTFETISKIIEQLSGCLEEESSIVTTIFEWMETNVYIMQTIIETRRKLENV